MRFARQISRVKKRKNGGNGHGRGGGKANGKPRSIDERFDSIDQRLGSIEKLLKFYGSDIRNLKNGVAFLRARVDDGFARFEARFERIEDHLGMGPPPEN